MNDLLILQQLQDSEINFELSCFYDAGFKVRLGDEMNGFLDEATVGTVYVAVEWLKQASLKHYPNSSFAKQSKETWKG